MNDSSIVYESPYSVLETINRIKAVLEKKSIKIFTLIDHSGEAKDNGLDLKDEKLLIFGDPKVGTYLMQENPEIGLELPLKILIWGENGKTRIAHQNLNALKKRYNIVTHAKILENMSLGLPQLITHSLK